MKRVINLLMVIFISSLISCNNKDEKLKVKDVEIFKDTPAWYLAKALEKSNLREAKEILSKNNKDLMNYQDLEFGTTLLMRAISTENYKAVEFLLQNGANPNIVSKTGTTALFRSVAHSWKDVTASEDSKFVKIMLDNGADPNIPYCAPVDEGTLSPIECGTSPLMHATQRGFEKAKLLIDSGADINYKTKLGTTAAIKALLNEKVDVAHYLIVEKKARVDEPYYYYYLNDRNKINYEKPHLPISLLENCLFELGSKEHSLKMEIVKEFKRQGQDYWSMEKHPKTVERIKKLYSNNWQNYLEKY